MSKREIARRKSARSRSNDHAGRWKLNMTMALFVLILVTGFFFAARQHFSSMDYGIRNSKLRKQLDDLETEKRRLMLAREVALSPNEIKRVSKKFGISESETAAPMMASASLPAKPATAPVNVSASGTAKVNPGYSVVATSFSADIRPAKTEKAKQERSDRARVIPTAAVAAR